MGDGSLPQSQVPIRQHHKFRRGLIYNRGSRYLRETKASAVRMAKKMHRTAACTADQQLCAGGSSGCDRWLQRPFKKAPGADR